IREHTAALIRRERIDERVDLPIRVRLDEPIWAVHVRALRGDAIDRLVACALIARQIACDRLRRPGALCAKFWEVGASFGQQTYDLTLREWTHPCNHRADQPGRGEPLDVAIHALIRRNEWCRLRPERTRCTGDENECQKSTNHES